MEEEVAITMFDTDKYALAVKQGGIIDHYDQAFLSHCVYSLVVFFCHSYSDAGLMPGFEHSLLFFHCHFGVLPL